MRRKFYSLILVYFLGSLFTQNVLAQDFEKFLEEQRKKTFSGFDTVGIVIESLRDDIKKEGLSETQIQTDVEIRLRKAGLKIAKSASPWLYINVNSIRDDQYSFAYSIHVSLNQSVVLERDKSVFLTAKTWERNSIGIVGTSKIRGIKDSISDFVDEFINEYLKANLPNTSRNPSNNDEAEKMLQDVRNNPSNSSQKQDSPFTAIFIGANRPPEVEIFNDSDRTLYLDFGQNALTPYTIAPKTSKKFTLTEGLYKYKATAPRVVPLAGEKSFEKGIATLGGLSL